MEEGTEGVEAPGFEVGVIGGGEAGADEEVTETGWAEVLGLKWRGRYRAGRRAGGGVESGGKGGGRKGRREGKGKGGELEERKGWGTRGLGAVVESGTTEGKVVVV